MSVDADSTTRRSISSRGRRFVLSLIEPKRGSGLLALLQAFAVALCALLGAVLLWLGLAQSHASWRLVAFAALFLSGSVHMLGPFLPRRFAVAASLAGLAGLVASVVCVQLSSSA